jgi:PKD repeat protein
VVTIEIIGQDDELPVLTIVSPADGSTLDTAEVTFSVDFLDLISGIDPASLAISIDGVDATGFFTVSDGNALYSASLGDGPHTVSASVSDRAGNTATATSNFTIETAAGLVSLPRAVPDSGDAPLTVRFIPEFETDTAIERFQWDFDGDGIFDRSEVIGRNQTYTYNTPGVYNALLRVTDSTGEQADGIAVVTVGNSPPEITAEAFPSNGQIPLTVSFTLTATDSEGVALYEWDFEGDGVFDYSSPTSGNTAFTYTEAGTFQAVARVTDTLGASATLALPTTEVRSAPPGSPSVTASANPSSGTVPLNVLFNASATDPDGEAFTVWEWDFEGDGTFDTSAAAPATSFTYGAPGTYFARVRVTAADGGTAEDVVQIVVLPSVSLSVTTDTIDPNLASAGVRTVLGGDTRVSVVIENRSGDTVKTLVPWGVRPAGTYTDEWGGDDETGAVVAEGDYYAVLLYEVDGLVSRLDLRQSTGGAQSNPPRSRLPRSFQPFANNPLTINFTLSRASEVTAFMGRFFVNTRLVTFLERQPSVSLWVAAPIPSSGMVKMVMVSSFIRPVATVFCSVFLRSLWRTTAFTCAAARMSVD